MNTLECPEVLRMWESLANDTGSDANPCIIACTLCGSQVLVHAVSVVCVAALCVSTAQYLHISTATTETMFLQAYNNTYMDLFS